MITLTTAAEAAAANSTLSLVGIVLLAAIVIAVLVVLERRSNRFAYYGEVCAACLMEKARRGLFEAQLETAKRLLAREAEILRMWGSHGRQIFLREDLRLCETTLNLEGCDIDRIQTELSRTARDLGYDCQFQRLDEGDYLVTISVDDDPTVQLPSPA